MIQQLEHPETIDLGSPDFGGLLTVSEAANLLGISDRRLRKICAEGRIGRVYSVIGYGRSSEMYLIRPEEVAEFSQTRKGPGRPKRIA